MTSLTVSETRQANATRALRFWPMVLCALLVGLVLSWARLDAVWRTGAFFDSDDAMRLVQVRDLLGGQAWFDMSAYRLDPPAGVFSHWSRVVDIPLALMIAGFEFALPPETAERLARLAFPLLMQAALLFAMARLASLLMDRRAGALAILLGLLSGIVFGQFQPGRIDHHAPQIVLLVAMLGHVVAAFTPSRARAREAAFAAGLGALSLGISLENLPFILALVGTLATLWVVRGNAVAPQMRFYAAGLALALPLVFAATVAPSRWTLGVPDALSATQLVAGCLGAFVLAVLPFGVSRPAAIGPRVALAGLGAVFVLAATAWLAPAGLRAPFDGLDPLVRALWLHNVREVWTLHRLWQDDWFSAASYTLPLGLGALGVATAIWQSAGMARIGWLFVAAVLAVGIAMSLVAVRVLTFAGPIAAFGGVALVLHWHDGLARRGRAHLAALSLAAVLPFSAMGWGVALALAAVDTPAHENDACLTTAALAPLAALPPGLVLAPIDVGAHLLAATQHSVLAAPYHRNNDGNRRALDALLAPPDAAQARVAASGARYLFICARDAEFGVLKRHAPDGLAAALAGGRIPAWLTPIPLAGTPFQAFAISPMPKP